MPAKSKAPQAQPEPVYPNLERFVEATDRQTAEKLFASTKNKLNDLAKGAKAPAAKKAFSGIERAEGLLKQLYEVRGRLESEAREAKKARR